MGQAADGTRHGSTCQRRFGTSVSGRYSRTRHARKVPRLQDGTAYYCDRSARKLDGGARQVRPSREGRRRGGADCWPQEHENAYSRWPSAVLDSENRRDFDRVDITRRDGTVIYDNHLVTRNGREEWEKPSRAFEILITERNRPVSAEDANASMPFGISSLRAPRCRASRREPLRRF